jgi:hypothetical protein
MLLAHELAMLPGPRGRGGVVPVEVPAEPGLELLETLDAGSAIGWLRRSDVNRNGEAEDDWKEPTEDR